MELLLVRHSEATGQEPEAPLTSEGYEQAEALAVLLRQEPIDRIVSSPFRRARETIAPFAERRGLVVHTDARLSERRLSERPIASWRDIVRSSFTDLEARAPGGESGRETLDRGWAAIEETLAAGHRLPLLVSHGQLLALVLHSLQPDFGYPGWESLRNPDVFRLSGPPGGRLRFERWSP